MEEGGVGEGLVPRPQGPGERKYPIIAGGWWSPPAGGIARVHYNFVTVARAIVGGNRARFLF